MTVGELIPIQDGELLAKVKEGLNMDGNDYQNNAILVWINEVKQTLLFAGVSSEVLGSTLAVGCIARGVDETYIQRLTAHTEMFNGMVERLRSTKVEV